MRDPWAALRYMVLPAVSLGFNQSALIARIARSCMVEVLQQDYIRTARAKGLPHRVVAYVHGFRNALVPVVTQSLLQPVFFFERAWSLYLLRQMGYDVVTGPAATAPAAPAPLYGHP